MTSSADSNVSASSSSSGSWLPREDENRLRLILIRHGQTEHSVHHLFSGSVGDAQSVEDTLLEPSVWEKTSPSDTPHPLVNSGPALTTVGHHQAKRAAQLLSQLIEPQEINRIIVSPLLRTQETAHYIAQVTDCPVTTHPLVRECHFGQWEGLSMEQVAEKDPDLLSTWVKDATQQPPGGESLMQVDARIQQVTQYLMDHYAGQTIAVVSHVGPIKAFLRQAMGAGQEMFFSSYLDLASISVVDRYRDSQGRVTNGTLRVMNYGAQL